MEYGIYFSDLKEEVQKEILEFYGVESYKDLDVSFDYMPLAILTKEE